MKSRILLPLLLLLSLPTPSPLHARSDSYDDVVVVINERSWASREIGRYFAARRGIPEERICRIDADTLESMDSATFTSLRWQIEAWLREHDPADAINYIVTTKGCPLRITTQRSPGTEDWQNRKYVGQCSFEDCLALSNGADSIEILAVKEKGLRFSKYYISNLAKPTPFRRDPVSLPMYLVTRLDAFTVEEVKGMIRRAEEPDAAGDGLFVFDVDPTRTGSSGDLNALMQTASARLNERGLHVLLNNDQTYVRDQSDVLGYASFGSNDANAGGYAGLLPKNTWANGAIAQMFVSTSARTFSASGEGQTLIGELIAEGVSGIIGYTDEPYASAMARPHTIYNLYTNGFTMAESFFAAMPYVAWRQVVVGDPKMRLARDPSGIVGETTEDGGSSARFAITCAPAGSHLVVRYDVAERGAIRLELFDELGRRVATSSAATQAPGLHSDVLDIARLPSGLYLVRLMVAPVRGMASVSSETVIIRR